MLLQENLLVTYVSVTLNTTQQRYSEIEKETRAVLLELEKFHPYVYGTEFIVDTDDRPLLAIFSETIECIVTTAAETSAEIVAILFLVDTLAGKGTVYCRCTV